MKKVLLVGIVPLEVRTMLLAQKDVVLIHESHEFDNNQIVFDVLKDYDAVILTEASDFSFHILEEMAVQCKPVLFRNAYENSEKSTKIQILMEKAQKKKFFLEPLSLYDAAPLYAEIAKHVENPIRRVTVNKSFGTNFSEGRLEAQINEYLYCLDKALKRERKRTSHFYNDGEKKISRVEGKVNYTDYTLNVIRSDKYEEKFTILFGENERLEVYNGEITFYPRQGTVKKIPSDLNYLPTIEPLLKKFVQSIGQL